MSAYGVGAEAATVKGGTRTNISESTTTATIVKWIPGEAITFYAAILGVGATQGALTGNETPEQLLERINAGSPGWFTVGAAIAALLVIAGGLTAHRDDSDAELSRRSVAVRLVLALASFVLWTTALPGAWPYNWEFIRDMGPAYALLLVPVAVIFSGVAEWATRKYNL